LLYTVFVCDAIYKTFSNDDSIINQELSIRLMTAYILSENQLREQDKQSLELTPLICKKCSSIVEIDDKNLKRIYEKGWFKCPKRHKNILFEV